MSGYCQGQFQGNSRRGAIQGALGTWLGVNPRRARKGGSPNSNAPTRQRPVTSVDVRLLPGAIPGQFKARGNSRRAWDMARSEPETGAERWLAEFKCSDPSASGDIRGCPVIARGNSRAIQGEGQFKARLGHGSE